MADKKTIADAEILLDEMAEVNGEAADYLRDLLKKNNPTKSYEFWQNNSGGFYDGPEKIWVVANSAEEANYKAEASGLIYFDGCSTGADCSCCGDRWNEVGESDLKEIPENTSEDCIIR